MSHLIRVLRKRPPHTAVLVTATLFLITGSGCNENGQTVLPRPAPPVTITYRDSLVGIGKVIQIKNTSADHLYKVKVVGRNFQQNSSGSVKATDDLAPGDVAEVGWMEFGAWTPQPGETVEVYSEGYLVPAVSYIPK